ncbi:hypothetical protein BJX99DRAFT_219549 [Aspergillus californicus]
MDKRNNVINPLTPRIRVAVAVEDYNPELMLNGLVSSFVVPLGPSLAPWPSKLRSDV